MIFKMFLLFFIFIQKILGNEICDCGPLTHYYSELRCTPIFEDEKSCCPAKYDCSHLEKRDPEKCYLLGVEYGKEDSTVREEISCAHGCYCSEGKFKCYMVYDDFIPFTGYESCMLKKGCKMRYGTAKFNTCNKREVTCPPSQTCFVDGKYYKEEEIFKPASNKSLICQCLKGFEGKFEAPFCTFDRCLTEFYYENETRENCTPLFEIDRLCPRSFICSMPNVTIIEGCTESTDYCRIGNDLMKKGDSFYTDDDVFCECSMPPFATCVTSGIPTLVDARTFEYDY